MIKKINLIVATLYSIILAIVEVMLNWGDWQYAPLWIVDYLIVNETIEGEKLDTLLST